MYDSCWVSCRKENIDLSAESRFPNPTGKTGESSQANGLETGLSIDAHYPFMISGVSFFMEFSTPWKDFVVSMQTNCSAETSLLKATLYVVDLKGNHFGCPIGNQAHVQPNAAVLSPLCSHPLADCQTPKQSQVDLRLSVGGGDRPGLNQFATSLVQLQDDPTLRWQPCSVGYHKAKIQ